MSSSARSTFSSPPACDEFAAALAAAAQAGAGVAERTAFFERGNAAELAARAEIAKAAADDKTAIPANAFSSLLVALATAPPLVLAKADAPDLSIVLRPARLLTRPDALYCDKALEAQRQAWRVFTCGSLDGLDWSNVIAAGGAVAAVATTAANGSGKVAAAVKKANKALCAHAAGKPLPDSIIASPLFSEFHGRGAAGGLERSDVDLFIYGLTPPKAAEKLLQIGATMAANARAQGRNLYAARTKNTVTFFSAYPYRPVQVNLGLFPCAAAVLLDFDFDCCAFAFDGPAGVRALPRALAALATGLNVMRPDCARHDVRRALKYLARGVGLALPRGYVARGAGALGAERTADLFSWAKLKLLLECGAVQPEALAAVPTGLDALVGGSMAQRSINPEAWREAPMEDPYPRTELAHARWQWQAGLVAPGVTTDPLAGQVETRVVIDVVGPFPGDGSGRGCFVEGLGTGEEDYSIMRKGTEAEKAAEKARAAAVRAAFQQSSGAAQNRSVEASAALVSAVYSSGAAQPYSFSCGKSAYYFKPADDPARGLPGLIMWSAEYLPCLPTSLYGPPNSDFLQGPLTLLSGVVFSGGRSGWGNESGKAVPLRAPHSADETAELIALCCRGCDVKVARTEEEIRKLIGEAGGGGGAFSTSAAFQDVHTPRGSGGGPSSAARQPEKKGKAREAGGGGATIAPAPVVVPVRLLQGSVVVPFDAAPASQLRCGRGEEVVTAPLLGCSWKITLARSPACPGKRPTGRTARRRGRSRCPRCWSYPSSC